MGFRNLTELANEYGSDKGTVHGDRHNYTALYDLIFQRFRYSPISFLELGLARGGAENPGISRPSCSYSPSVEMWLAYFPAANIYGFDITDFSSIKNSRFHFVRGDASASEDLIRLASTAPHFNIIMDDGSHASPHQQLAFKYLFPALAPGGIYIIEDLHWQSPVFESLIYGLPKTADFFSELIYRDNYIPNPILSEPEVRSMMKTAAVRSIFPSLNGDTHTRKLLIIEKKI